MKNTILFDLDGTLLPMDNSEFERAYFKGLCSVMRDVPSDKLIEYIWTGTKAMVKNDGSKTNREVFAEAFTEASGIDYYENEERFLDFYRTDFQKCAEVCAISDISAEIVRTVQNKGFTAAIATNPIFPKIATDSRLCWLGIDPNTLPLVTNFENSRHAKPNLDYYREVCEKLHVAPTDCIMVGNDAEEDACAAALGMEVVLISDCLINKKNLPIDKLHKCTLKEFYQWIKNFE